jgi:nucleoid DNA-binding protein
MPNSAMQNVHLCSQSGHIEVSQAPNLAIWPHVFFYSRGIYAKFSAVRIKPAHSFACFYYIHNYIIWERHMATKSKASKKPSTKSEILGHISDKTSLSRKQVSAVFDELAVLIKRDLKSSGLFNVVGLLKIKLVHKPAQPAHKGINPFTKEEMMFKAKPARNVVKVLPLKSLKDMV